MSVLTQIAAALDPAKLMEQAGFEPDPWQQEVLRTDDPRVLLLCCRQSGKSTVAAALAVHTAITKPNALVLLLSPSLRQSAELFRMVTNVYKRAARQSVPLKQESGLTSILTLVIDRSRSGGSRLGCFVESLSPRPWREIAPARGGCGPGRRTSVA